VKPDFMLVPLAAFDRSGGRIGYGAGYYDMTISAVRAHKPVVVIGVAYAAQEVPEVPILAHDARLDLVLTEREMIDCRGA
jgi:5-formyltetrahydrofolate cyclo-ligase